MDKPVYRFMPARELMNLAAGNWASWESDRTVEREPHADDDSLIEVPWVRFVTDRARATGACRGGVVMLDLAPMVESDDYVRERGEVFVLADVLVAEPVSIELQP